MVEVSPCGYEETKPLVGRLGACGKSNQWSYQPAEGLPVRWLQGLASTPATSSAVPKAEWRSQLMGHLLYRSLETEKSVQSVTVQYDEHILKLLANAVSFESEPDTVNGITLEQYSN